MARVLTVTANVCIPALPPIDATIGIKKARTTICSMVAPNKLIQYVAKNAVKRFNNNQLNRLLVFVITPSVISSSPTPANLNASSSASSFKTVRTLATNDLTKNNFNQNIFKEFNIGILNGIIFAIISSFIVQLWFQDIILSLIISISMILTMIVAGLFGILVPVTLKKMNIDPAIASSVFVTTITDVIGFVSFLGVGAYFL